MQHEAGGASHPLFFVTMFRSIIQSIRTVSKNVGPPALAVQGISKTYRLWPSPAARLWVPALYRCAALLPLGLRARLRARMTAAVHQHHALADVSFTLRRGEALGIIGHNGSGKSTLLQIVAGVLQPTTGCVQVNGRVAALLELGSGFNPELTGTENVRINAAVLGMTAAQVDQRLPSILAFADIGDYVDEPVKTYSSGMALRLAFAVQVHTDPDILIVDEALAVGDAAFQAKAMSKMDEILAGGATLLFVGHDLNAVKAFCHRAMLLEKGRVVMEGLPDAVITEYLGRVHREALAHRKPQVAATLLDSTTEGSGTSLGIRDARINDGCTHVSLRYAAKVRLELQIALNSEVQAPAVIVDILDGKGLQLTGRRIALPPGNDVVRVELAFDAAFQLGVYRVRLRLVDAPTLETTMVLERREGILSFDVIDDSRAAFTGLFPIPMDIRVGD